MPATSPIFEDEITFEPCYAPGSGRPIALDTLDNRFGDGYRQLAANSINPIERSWELKLDALTGQEWQSLDEFLKSMAGVTTFMFQPPSYEGLDPDTQTVDNVAVICDQWSPVFLTGGHVNASMTFTERFGE